MNLLLDSDFQAFFSGGTLDFRSLGRERLAGIDRIEILLPGQDLYRKIKIHFWWSAEIANGEWKTSIPPIDSMTTDLLFLKDMETLGQDRFKLYFRLADAKWCWILKPKHKGRRVTFEMACGLGGTSS